MNHADLDRLRRRVRARALSNLLARLGQQAAASRGRLHVDRQGQDLIFLDFKDVWTLTQTQDDIHRERVDFRVLLSVPDQWPWDPHHSLTPMVLKPSDWAHPNSDRRFLCVDLSGVLPERLATLLHDNLRLARFRLDDPVDTRVANYVRTHLADFPTDDRELLPDGNAR